MNEAFDAYYKWLGIRPEDQPPHHYRLLALSQFESDPDVIASAADQRMSHLRGMQTGKHAALSQRLLNEISAAKICLLNPDKKAEYDRQLQAKLEALAPPVASVQVEQPASASPLETLVDVQQTVAGASTGRSIRPSKRSLPLPALMAAGGLAAVVAGIAAFWQFGASSQPAPDSIAAGSVSTDHAPPPAKTGPPAPEGNDKPNSGTTSGKKTGTGGRPGEDRPPTVPPAVGGVKGSAAADSDSDDNDSDSTAADDSVADDDEFWTPGAGTPDKPPPATASGKRNEIVDLLKLIEPARDSISGGWTRDGGALVSPAGIPFARLQVPYAPPAAYQLTAVVERAAAGDSFSLGLVVGTSQPAVVLDGWNNKKSGIAMVDGRWGDWNETAVDTPDLLKGGQHTIVCRVQPDRIEVQVDQRKIIDWQGDSRRLSIDPRTPLRSAQQLYLVSHLASIRIMKLGSRAALAPVAEWCGRLRRSAEPCSTVNCSHYRRSLPRTSPFNLSPAAPPRQRANRQEAARQTSAAAR